MTQINLGFPDAKAPESIILRNLTADAYATRQERVLTEANSGRITGQPGAISTSCLPTIHSEYEPVPPR